MPQSQLTQHSAGCAKSTRPQTSAGSMPLIWSLEEAMDKDWLIIRQRPIDAWPIHLWEMDKHRPSFGRPPADMTWRWLSKGIFIGQSCMACERYQLIICWWQTDCTPPPRPNVPLLPNNNWRMPVGLPLMWIWFPDDNQICPVAGASNNVKLKAIRSLLKTSTRLSARGGECQITVQKWPFAHPKQPIRALWPRYKSDGVCRQ